MMKKAWPDRLVLHFGAFAEPIGKQLCLQGITAPKRQVRLWEDLARALTLVRLHHVVSEAAARRGEQRLGRDIIKWLRAHSKE